MPIEIKLPSLGDQIDSGDVLEVKVREGDVIKKDQGIVELETEKATVEVPSTHAGKVLKIHVQDGQTIKIGASLITLEENVASAASPSTPARGSPAAQSPVAESPAAPAKSGRPPETKSTETKSAETKSAETKAQPAKAPEAKPAAAKSAESKSPAGKSPAGKSQDKQPTEAKSKESRGESKTPPPKVEAGEPEFDTGSDDQGGDEPESVGGGITPAGPAVRRFAREVGVDLANVTGTGTGGRITRDDILTVVRQANEVARSRGTPSASASSTTATEASDSDSWGAVRYEKLTKIRKTIAAKMSQSWSTATRVTNFDDADVTELERIRQSSKDDYAANGIKLTALPFVTKAVAMALKKHPVINAAIDLENDRLIYKNYVNIGIAVDTDRGLVVPVLRDVDKLSISEIAWQLASIADKVRSGSFTMDEMRGATFSISNLGAIGGTYSTPIINVPEVAILLVGRSRKMAAVINDEVKVRLMMPLSLSYDHRLVDGAAAARYLNDVIAYLETPSRLLLAP